MTLIYIDTNIYMDYLLGRDRFSELAFRIFCRSIDCEFHILISSKVLEELYGNIEFDKTKMLLSLLKPKLKIVTTEKDDEIRAKKISSHYQDALHALTANRFGADLLITRNIKHFRKYKNLVKPKLPENI